MLHFSKAWCFGSCMINVIDKTDQRLLNWNVSEDSFHSLSYLNGFTTALSTPGSGWSSTKWTEVNRSHSSKNKLNHIFPFVSPQWVLGCPMMHRLFYNFGLQWLIKLIFCPGSLLLHFLHLLKQMLSVIHMEKLQFYKIKTQTKFEKHFHFIFSLCLFMIN